MPWLSIIMAIISFLGTLKKDKSNVGQAALAGAAVGLGTYYVSHETEWGRTNLGSLDGVVQVGPGGDVNSPVSTTDGGSPVKVPITTGSNTVTGSTGSSWTAIKDNLVPLGTGALIGSAASKSSFPWGLLIVGFAGLMILTR